MPTDQFNSMRDLSQEEMDDLIRPKSSPLSDMGMPTTFKPNENVKNYIGCKIIKAEPMSQEAFLKDQGKWQENQETYGDGYKVYYADNYTSWSPKKVFEEAYRLVSNSEMNLLHKQF